MRTRMVVAIVALLVPAALSAQRIPIGVGIGHRGPAHPEPIPRQPEPIATELAYHRLRVSMESYPMVSFFSSPAYATNGRATSWASFGTGTRIDYRITSIMSATLDVTSSFIGGPELVETAELGTRFRPERNDKTRLYPFIDARVGYIAAYTRGLGIDGFTYTDPAVDSFYGGAKYSHGFGLLGGAGFEYALSHSWSLITSGMLVRSSMTSSDFSDPVNRGFTLTAFRYTLGVRYNPIRMIRAVDTR